MLRRFRLPVFVASAALLAGCFQVESVLSVRPDGSATLTEQISADGLMGLMLRKSATETAAGDDRSDRYGPGVRVASVEHTVTPGAVRVTTVYDVADVSQLRYDLDDAFDTDEVGTAVGAGPAEKEGDAPAFEFGFTPATGGAPAQLRVLVPEMGDLADFDASLSDSPLGDMFGTDAPQPGDAYDEALVLMGTMAMRFSVQAEGLLDADGGWADGDRVTFADVSMGTFLTYMHETGQFDGPAEPLDSSSRDLPGYRVAPPGTATIRFR